MSFISFEFLYFSYLTILLSVIFTDCSVLVDYHAYLVLCLYSMFIIFI